MGQRNKVIQEDSYIRERLSPSHGDKYYLHLSDLRRVLDEIQTEENIRVLDFGCGGSPYRALFPNADYRRADFSEIRNLDYVIDELGNINEESETFDLILSTQVLEHVPCPSGYLRECFRLLKPGGTLVLVTHGTYEEHPCPGDYYRWTSMGLKSDHENAGFMVKRVVKLTTGPRAALFILEQFLPKVDHGRNTLFDLFLRLSRMFLDRFRGYVHKQSDISHNNYRCVNGDSKATFFISILITSTKP